MKTLAATETRTFRLIGAGIVMVCLFLSFASFASVPMTETVAGAALWFAFGVGNLISGTAVLMELALDRG